MAAGPWAVPPRETGISGCHWAGGTLEIKPVVFGVSVSIQGAVEVVPMGHRLGGPFGAQTVGCLAGVAGSHTIVYI